MEGPSKADIDFTDNKDGTCDVQYTCTEPGTKLNGDTEKTIKSYV